MRVSDYGKQPVRSRDFWKIVTIVAALLVGVGLFTMGYGQLPKAVNGIGTALVLLGWAATLWTLIRRGRQNFSLPYLLFFVGYTLFFGVPLLSTIGGNKAGKSSALSFVGTLLMLPFVLSPFVDFRKRRAPKT